MQIRPGDIVWANPGKARGQNKTRPLLVVADVVGNVVNCVAFTKSPIDPREWRYVPMPWNPNGSAATKLKNQCWAVCDWVVPLDTDEIEEVKGHVSAVLLNEIRAKVRTCTGQG